MYLVSHFSVDLLCLYLCLRLRLTVIMVIIFGILPSPYDIFDNTVTVLTRPNSLHRQQMYSFPLLCLNT